MKTIGIMSVRNEADVLGQVLRHNAELFDVLFVTDNGSVDETRHVILSVLQEYPNIQFLGTFKPVVPEEIRFRIWSSYRHDFSRADWWVIIDGDEFIEETLRRSIRAAATENADYMLSHHANFYYKQSERDAWERGSETVADRTRPIKDRRRWYRMHISMPRAFRNAHYIRWYPGLYFPAEIVKPASRPLLFRHYQYRDLGQIETRVRTRLDVTVDASYFHDNPHWLKRAATELVSPEDDPTLLYWDGVSELKADAAIPPIPAPCAATVVAKRIRSEVRAALRPQLRYDCADYRVVSPDPGASNAKGLCASP
jgi:glycosyltransferase involved in cell wall biosynthesis